MTQTQADMRVAEVAHPVQHDWSTWSVAATAGMPGMVL